MTTQEPQPVQLLIDDERIKLLIVNHGHAADLEPKPEWRGQYRLHAVWKEEDTIYLVRRYIGYPIPEDNGYKALIVPVEGRTTEQLQTIIDSFIEEGQTGPTFYEDWRKHQPENS